MADRASATAALIQVGQLLYHQGVFRARAGNLSMRLDDGTVLITCAHTHKGLLTATDFVLLDADGQPLDAAQPSSEVALHMAAYHADPAIGAVGHAHPLSATELAHRALHLQVDLAEEGPLVLGNPPLLPDRPRELRTQRWAEAVAAGTRAALLEHHGIVVAGSDWLDMLCKLELAEWIATLQMRLRSR